MAGYRFIVRGNQMAARDTAYAALQNQGFALTQTSDWEAWAERGSKGASIALGALAGKKNRHVVLGVACAVDEQNNLVITLTEGTSGWSGGLIGKGQADSVYIDVYQAIASAFQAAGVLVAGTPL